MDTVPVLERLATLATVVEYDFHGGSRRQEAQRYGRVMHGASTGEHLILMIDAECSFNPRFGSLP